MKVKGIFNRRKKKTQGSNKVFKETISNEDNTIPSDTSGESDKWLEEGSAAKDIVLKKFSDNVDGSSMAMFARMSTAIADTLSENEFGMQKNSLYRPHSNSYTSQVVYPVLCKRDIFVESVTPTKSKGKRSKNASIYHVDDKESYMIKSNAGRIGQRNNSSSTTSRQSQKIMKSKASKSATNGSNVASYSISASMLFREKKRLSIETGRIGSDDDQHLPANRNRLHYVQQSDYGIEPKHRKPPKYANSPVSPSSTVSSLTIPAELDFDPTPRALFHQQMMSPPMLAGIQEQSDSGEVSSPAHKYPMDELKEDGKRRRK